MKGWTGHILRINLTNRTHKIDTFGQEFAHKWVGGRGFALKVLWDELRPGIDPLGPENKLIIAVGPIAGVPAPNTGKTVVAAKSPLTGGFGDGNLGTRATEHMRKAGYDSIIFEGQSDKPIYVYIEDDKVQYFPADEIWGRGTYDTHDYLYKIYGKGVGILSIGQGGENLNRYAMIRSLEGRAGGRPGIGAVMGSKNLKAIVIKGSKPIPVADPEGMRKLGIEDLRKVGEINKQTGWSIQSTTGVLSWCNEVAALPVHNMRQTHHPDAWKIDGERLNNARVATYGCPNCTMRCGIAIRDHEGHESELDYENIGTLGSNLDIFELDQVGSLNYLCDDYGLDTISAGDTLAFYADAIEQGAIKGDFRFGDAEMAKKLLGMAARRQGEIGNLLADGTMRMSRAIGHGSEAYAMHVKGLEISAYNCKFCPGMALAFATCPLGGHHKDSWVITFEIKQTKRDSYGPEKAAKVIELQRIRGGLFEFIVACRFPWIELGWPLEHYPEYFNRVTGLTWSLDDFWKISDRIYALMKFFWVREFPDWDRTRDYPPMIWFDPSNADKDGPIAGKILELDKFNQLLDHYYEQRGWDERGIPTKKTAEALDLKDEMAEVEKYTRLE
ncbi:MAG TPA: aldehyde ferredoxin oxidoreductase family protein [Candidatus Saccharicenans sp.]|jgi:aldehyde:ferredoxin oxidoreductase|nr:aldehyde ferredoxin oxidoreductase family protein [Candidatus Saccharicenans sp.]HRD01279.1 aldehyde ferredoxin oxidoreductase family protein [Candidatus Saccharicenans sp.]